MAYDPEYYKTHKRQILAQQNAWRKRNREQVNARQREQYAALPQEEKERRRQLTRDWLAKNLDKLPGDDKETTED